jgi:hypothetical protein
MEEPTTKILEGNCLEILKGIESDSIDSVVTDPPYEILFMSRKWDNTGIAHNVDMWKEVLRVLKPGGHLLSFGAPRTYHRMACAIEDAGFELRDCIMWVFGSGWPKGQDISKGIDKKFGAEREVVSTRKGSLTGFGRNLEGREIMLSGCVEITAPSTPEAQKWEGWNTNLKPSYEPIVMARKPLGEKTIVDNVLKHGTGAINIDDCRIETTDTLSIGAGKLWSGYRDTSKPEKEVTNPGSQHEGGRYPANLIHDGSDEVLEAFWNEFVRPSQEAHPSRFFYCAKASENDRGKGNDHMTVKPIDLMRYLVRLVTPVDGVVLDPFAGSGTTLLAARMGGFNSIGIEMEPKHVKIIRKRLNLQ